jgi:hypothetical protein
MEMKEEALKAGADAFVGSVANNSARLNASRDGQSEAFGLHG